MYRNHHQLGFVRGKSHEPEKIKLPPLDSSGEKIRRTRRAGGERRIRYRGSRVGFQTPDGDECKKPSVGGHESTGSRFGERTRVPGVFVATNYRFGVRDRLRPRDTYEEISGRGANASEDIKGPARGNYCFSIPANRNRERGGACTIGAAILTLSFFFFLSFPSSFFALLTPSYSRSRDRKKLSSDELIVGNEQRRDEPAFPEHSFAPP